MKRLDLYIFQQLAWPFVISTVCITMLVWLSQTLQRVDLMVKDGGTFSSFLQVTILLIPSLLAAVIPFSLFGTVLFVFNRLLQDNEIAVLASAGTSRVQIARPVLVLALLATAFTYWVTIDLGPRSSRGVQEVVRSVRDDLAKSLITSRKFVRPAENIVIYTEKILPGEQYLGMLIYDTRVPQAPVTYLAEKGLFDKSQYGPRLHLLRGNIQRIAADGDVIDIVEFQETTVDLSPFDTPANIKTLAARERFLPELFSPDLRKKYDRRAEGLLIAEGHLRIASPLYNILFAIIALVFTLTGPTSRTGYGKQILLAVMAGLLFRVLGFTATNAGQNAVTLNWLQYALPIAGSMGGIIVLVEGRPNLSFNRPPESLKSIPFLSQVKAGK